MTPVRVPALLVVLLVLASSFVSDAQERRYPVRGMVLSVDATARTVVVSHERIPGLMEAMAMPFEVRDAQELRGLVPGAVVDFTLLMGAQAAYATAFTIRRYETMEQDPLTARRLSVMKRMAGLATAPLEIGAQVPGFTLTDHQRRPFTLASAAGKVVAVNFIYTRCALPQFCLRVTNNFGVLQKRFQGRLGRDLILLTITFDPQRDTPEALARYAAQWKPDPGSWRFLTGAVNDVRRVCALFGVDYFPDEGLMNHSLRTAVIDRRGRLVANIEGNRYTPEQLGDLIEATFAR